MYLRTLLAFSTLMIVSAGFGCNSSSSSAPAATTSGPINGSYALTSLTCNGTSTSFLGTGELAQMLIVQNSTGSYITTFSDGCVATEGNVYTYPSSTTFTMQKVNRVCSGTSCSGAECTADSTAAAATTETYSLSGSTLTLTHTSDGTADKCSAGQTAILTFTKQ